MGLSGSFAAVGGAENDTVKLDEVQNSSTEFSGTLDAAGEELLAGTSQAVLVAGFLGAACEENLENATLGLGILQAAGESLEIGTFKLDVAQNSLVEF